MIRERKNFGQRILLEMFEAADSVFNIKSVPSNISYTSSKTWNLPMQNSYCDHRHDWSVAVNVMEEVLSLILFRSKRIKLHLWILFICHKLTTYNEKNEHYFLTLITAGWPPSEGAWRCSLLGHSFLIVPTYSMQTLKLFLLS